VYIEMADNLMRAFTPDSKFAVINDSCCGFIDFFDCFFGVTVIDNSLFGSFFFSFFPREGTEATSPSTTSAPPLLSRITAIIPAELSPSAFNALIGRAAHLAPLENDPFIRHLAVSLWTYLSETA